MTRLHPDPVAEAKHVYPQRWSIVSRCWLAKVSGSAAGCISATGVGGGQRTHIWKGGMASKGRAEVGTGPVRCHTGGRREHVLAHHWLGTRGFSPGHRSCLPAANYPRVRMVPRSSMAAQNQYDSCSLSFFTDSPPTWYALPALMAPMRTETARTQKK